MGEQSLDLKGQEEGVATGRKWDLGLEVNERPLGWFPVAAVTLGLRRHLSALSAGGQRSDGGLAEVAA